MLLPLSRLLLVRLNIGITTMFSRAIVPSEAEKAIADIVVLLRQHEQR